MTILLAVTLLLMPMLGGTAYADEPAVIRIVQYGEAGARNMEFFETVLAPKVKEDLNIDLQMDFVSWGATDQIAIRCASGEKFAFMCGITAATFFSWNKAGYFATIDEQMVREVAPKYIESRMGNDSFFASKFGSDIVLLPMGATAYFNMYDNFAVRNDLLLEVGMDHSQIKTVEDFELALEKVHEAHPEMYLIKNVNHFIRQFDNWFSMDGEPVMFDEPTPYVICTVNLMDDSDKVISWLESDYFKKLCNLTHDWFQKGYLTVEHLTDQSIVETAWLNGECFSSFAGPNQVYDHEVRVNGVLLEGAETRYVKLYPENPNFISKDYDWAFAISSADQDNVVNYLRFFNWVYESEENYRLALYGVEGIDYTIKDDGSLESITTDSFLHSWMCRTLMYDPINTEKFDPAEVDQYMQMSNDALLSKKTGFSFDTTAVQTEEALLTAIIQEKVKPIVHGLYPYDETFPAVLEELKAAGLDKYVAEYQRQFSEFMAGKNK
jgi:putative aldouronate transport system substrate-binding protein